MAAITQPSDYTGQFAITTNQLNIVKVQQFIDTYENIYLNQLFGVEMLADYLAGILDDDPIYTKLRDEFFENSKCHRLIHSRGVKWMLTAFVYWEYYRKDNTQATINGNKVLASENSQKPQVDEANIYSRYNEAVGTYKAIQDYIRERSENYPKFKGVDKLLNYWF